VAPPRRVSRSGVDDQHRAQVERVVFAGSGRVSRVHDVIPFHRGFLVLNAGPGARGGEVTGGRRLVLLLLLLW
jgi:hypothetical protein